uniref:Uncharacterized protein n=1 Tax=Arundo donax TaxID=35708 RepID=A0A0A9BN29_ARUDO
MLADRSVHVLHDPDPARPLLPLAVTKILRLGKQVLHYS